MIFRRNTRVGAEIPSSAMSDIAFLLLIFFMVTTTFAVKKGIDFKLPKESKDMEEIETVDQKAVEIQVLASGRILINREPKNLSDVRPFLEERLAQNPKQIVMLIVDDKATYGDGLDVLDELKSLNITNIALPTKEERKSWL